MVDAASRPLPSAILDQFRLDGETAIVTGGNRGIGRVIAGGTRRRRRNEALDRPARPGPREHRREPRPLGLDSVDLVYVHRLRGTYDPEETLAAMKGLREDGLVDGIAVSNFELRDLDAFEDVLGHPPAANQVEYHPLFQPVDRLEHARDHGYPLVAYSPLSGGEVGTVESVIEVAERHAITPEQVSLAWLLAKGVHPVPKASSREHVEANLAAVDVALDAEDVAAIDAVDRVHELYPE